MKTAPRTNSESAFTLVELLVVITLIAIVVIVLDGLDGGGSRVYSRGCQTRALSNAKQISLALRLYADDHDGKYPSYTLRDGKPSKIPVSDSNTAFAQLFPTYVNEEAIFWVAKSAFCSPNPPDEITDKPPLDTPVNTLKSGENEWAYVPGLDEKSNPVLPVIASGFANVKQHTYTTDPAQKGGVWQGRNAIVIHVDGSGIVAPVDQITMTVTAPNGGSTNGDIFTTANAANGWLTPANAVVNPK